MKSKPVHLILAPLHGYTEVAFRNALGACFGGFDEAIAPFVSLSPADRINPVRLHDLEPSRNRHLAVVPQLLGNEPPLMIDMAHAMSRMGYDRINWNMGCPKKAIAAKQRGSGLLPFPGLIDRILSEVVPAIPQRLSVKLRLGRHHPDEINAVAEVLNRYPLESVTIHPRIGIEHYTVPADRDRFERVMPLIKHPVTYNGDIYTVDDFVLVQRRFPEVSSFMIGRGVLANPFLGEQIKGIPLGSAEEQHFRFVQYVGVLMDELKYSSRSSHFLFKRMKDYWGFFAFRFAESEQIYRRLVRIQDEAQFFETQQELLHTAHWLDLNGTGNSFTGSKADKRQLEG